MGSADRPDPHENQHVLAAPTNAFRVESWKTFQRAIDPLGTPRRLPTRFLRQSARPEASEH